MFVTFIIKKEKKGKKMQERSQELEHKLSTNWATWIGLCADRE